MLVERMPRGLALVVDVASAGPSTTAPAPSPKRTQVVRSFQLMTRDRSSTPTTRTRFIVAGRDELVGDRQAEDEARARRAEVERRAVRGAPSFCWRKTAVAGIGMSGVTVADDDHVEVRGVTRPPRARARRRPSPCRS